MAMDVLRAPQEGTKETDLIRNSTFGPNMRLHVLCATQEGETEAIPIRNLALDPYMWLHVLHIPQESNDYTAPFRNLAFGPNMGLHVPFMHHKRVQRGRFDQEFILCSHMWLHDLCVLLEGHRKDSSTLQFSR